MAETWANVAVYLQHVIDLVIMLMTNYAAWNEWVDGIIRSVTCTGYEPATERIFHSKFTPSKIVELKFGTQVGSSEIREIECHNHRVPLIFDRCYRDVYQIIRRWYKSKPIFCCLETLQDIMIYHLSHRGQDKMATILQTIFFNAYRFQESKDLILN